MSWVRGLSRFLFLWSPRGFPVCTSVDLMGVTLSSLCFPILSLHECAGPDGCRATRPATWVRACGIPWSPFMLHDTGPDRCRAARACRLAWLHIGACRKQGTCIFVAQRMHSARGSHHAEVWGWAGSWIVRCSSAHIYVSCSSCACFVSNGIF